MKARVAWVLVAVLALLSGVVVSGCAGGVDRLSIPNPPSTTVAQPAPADTLSPTLDLTAEQPVGGITTTTQPVLGPGTSSLVGTVTNPAGQPVPGATVEIDRVVGDRYVSATTMAGGDGSWSLRNILGGDYRVRAWLTPDLDMPTPSQLFLAGGASQTVTLQETSYQDDQVQVAINPANPIVGQPADLVVLVSNPQVNADGVLTAPPQAGATVTLVNGNNWQVDNGNPLPTDSDGQAVFVVDCDAAGANPLSAEVGSGSPVNLQMPPCTVAPPTTTTTTNPYQYFTTTTCPPSFASTTTLAFGSSC